MHPSSISVPTDIRYCQVGHSSSDPDDMTLVTPVSGTTEANGSWYYAATVAKLGNKLLARTLELLTNELTFEDIPPGFTRQGETLLGLNESFWIFPSKPSIP